MLSVLRRSIDPNWSSTPRHIAGFMVAPPKDLDCADAGLRKQFHFLQSALAVNLVVPHENPNSTIVSSGLPTSLTPAVPFFTKARKAADTVVSFWRVKKTRWTRLS